MARFLTTAAVAAAAVLSVSLASAADDMGYRLLDPAAYQSFVGNWTPKTAPLCAAIGSRADWDRVLHPAATMGSHKPFSPPARFWKRSAVLLVARVFEAGPRKDDVFHFTGFQRSKDALTVDYEFHPNPPASFRVQTYLALAVRKPLPANVTFKEGGQVVCDLNLASGDWVSPPLPR